MGVFEFGVTYEGWFVTVCFLSFRILVVGSALKMPRLCPPVTCAEDVSLASTIGCSRIIDCKGKEIGTASIGEKHPKSIVDPKLPSIAEATEDVMSTAASNPLDGPR